jgi:hypothetical protein
MVKIVQIFLLVPRTRIKSKAKQKLSVDLCRRLGEGKTYNLKPKKLDRCQKNYFLLNTTKLFFTKKSRESLFFARVMTERFRHFRNHSQINLAKNIWQQKFCS